MEGIEPRESFVAMEMSHGTSFKKRNKVAEQETGRRLALWWINRDSGHCENAC